MYDNVVLAKALHYLLPPRAISSTGLKSTPSMEASQHSFYQFATDSKNLDEKINARIEYCKLKNIEPHPIIFGVKNEPNVRYVVVLRELRFYFDEFLNAFDGAFKTFNFFNIPYPPESLRFWYLVNALFYDLNSAGRDVLVTGKMHNTIKTLKAHISNKKPSRSRSRSPARSTPSTSSRRSNSSSPLCVAKK